MTDSLPSEGAGGLANSGVTVGVAALPPPRVLPQPLRSSAGAAVNRGTRRVPQTPLLLQSALAEPVCGLCSKGLKLHRGNSVPLLDALWGRGFHVNYSPWAPAGVTGMALSDGDVLGEPGLLFLPPLPNGLSGPAQRSSQPQGRSQGVGGAAPGALTSPCCWRFPPRFTTSPWREGGREQAGRRWLPKGCALQAPSAPQCLVLGLPTGVWGCRGLRSHPQEEAPWMSF